MTTSYLVPKLRYIALDTLYCGKWEKIQSQAETLTCMFFTSIELFQQYPMSKSSEEVSYPTIYSNFKILDH